jgi:hypothetical protein
MNFRQFYSRALLASLPIAADLVIHHGELLIDDPEEGSVDKAIAEMAQKIAFETSIHFGSQMEFCDQIDAEPTRKTTKTTIDVTGPIGSESSLN